MSTENKLVNKNLTQRLLSGVIGAAVFITFLVFNFYTFAFITALMLGLVLNEFYLMWGKYKPLRFLGLLIGLSSYGLVLLNLIGFWDIRLVVLIGVLVMSVPVVLLFDKDKNMMESFSITYMGLVYVALPCISLLLMSKTESIYSEVSYNRFLILGVFLVIWSNDTGAYFSGKLFGENKLFSRVSPNKTIEGSVGGVVLALIIITIYVKYIAESDFPYLWWVGFTLVISVAGILGDLIESQMKRNLGVKDSGNFLPGHGGVLDRFDAVIFALPFAYLTLLFL